MAAPLRWCVVAWAVVFVASFDCCANENWPQWRGPTGNGISDSKNLPTTWSLEKNENIVWKTELPSWSGGTPIIWGDYIFVTSPSKKEQTAAAPPPPEPGKGGKGGRPKRDPGGEKLLLVCLSKKDGSVRWQVELDEKNDRAFYGKAISLIKLERVDEAIPLLKKNIELQPLSPFRHYQLAHVYLRKGERGEAERMIRQVSRFEPQVAKQLEKETGIALTPLV